MDIFRRGAKTFTWGMESFRLGAEVFEPEIGVYGRSEEAFA
jgi:hypothetical protein